MAKHDMIVIGASAGGIEALTYLARELPSDLPAAVLVVVHTGGASHGLLARILARAGPLPVAVARDGDPIRPGHIYTAPPDYHLIVEDSVVRLFAGPRENHNRPAVDPLFRSAARAYGRRAIGVVLTGILDDGALGLQAIKMRGGLAVVQDPEDALYPGMPRSAVENVDADYVVALAELPSLLKRLAGSPAGDGGGEVMAEPSDPDGSESTGAMGPGDKDAEIVAQDKVEIEAGQKEAGPSMWTCPECGGVLWELGEEGTLHFRCHVGHVYTPAALAKLQSDDLEGALWAAVPALEEKAALAHRPSLRLARHNIQRIAAGFEEQAGEAEQGADLIRGVSQRQIVTKIGAEGSFEDEE